MPIKVYQSKRNKKLYEVYVSIRFKGERLQTRRRKDFQGNFITSLFTAKKVEFELKRELIAQKEGQPIWKWKGWLEECLRRMRFSLKHSTIMNYETILGKWIPEDWSKRELQTITKSEVHNLLLPRVREWRQGDQSRLLRDFCKGISIPEVKFHDLRATFITNMLSKGVALNVVMSIVGHRRIATTDIYNRLAGVGVKGSTNKLSYGLHFHARSSDVVIPLFQDKE